MDEKPKPHRWFQFHLSTAIILMFCAWPLLGFFTYLNHKPQDEKIVVTTTGSWMTLKEGWPFIFYDGPQDPNSKLPSTWYWAALAIDVAIALFLFYCLAQLCEYYIRYSEARKP